MAQTLKRNLVVCCDGTWNTPDQKDRGRVVPSNVVKMARAVLTDRRQLDAHEAPQQKIYYDTGVGTKTGFAKHYDRLIGGITGKGLSKNVKEAYIWLAENYRDGDHIFLFGFSRGAYTARSISGMIALCGLTDSDEHETDAAYNLYRSAHDAAGEAAAMKFRSAQPRKPRVRFLGVWDTVGALGVPALSKSALLQKTVRFIFKGSSFAHGFHHTGLGGNVDYAFHALAIDEKRGPFAPALWTTGNDGNDPPAEKVQQAWFAGAHSNVGGGYVDSGLSDHAFMWMAKHAMCAGLWLEEMYLVLRIDPNAHGELRKSMKGIYKLQGAHQRPIGRPDTLNEFTHASAQKRHRNDTNSYQPENAFDQSITDADGYWAPIVPVKTDGIDIVKAMRLSESKTGWVHRAVEGAVEITNQDLQ